MKSGKTIFNCILIALMAFSVTISATNAKVATVSAFSSALSVAKSGDTITLANQTWQKAIINFTGKSGTAIAPIVLRTETAGKVIITGNSNLSIGGKYLVVDGLFFNNAISPTSNLVQFRTCGTNYANQMICTLENCK